MKLYGIFNQNDNYKLLRYSTDEQTENTYSYTDPVSKTLVAVHEVCIPDIDYSENFIGKFYNLETQTFSE